MEPYTKISSRTVQNAYALNVLMATIALKELGQETKTLNELTKLKPMKVRGYRALVNKELGYAPYFSNVICYRINKKMATNVVFVGEAGVGKSYMAMDVARVVEGTTRSGKDRFKLDQVVFTYKDFMDVVLKFLQI